MEIEAVLFDVGNTLVFVDPVRMLEIFGECGVAVERETFAEAELAARLLLTRQVDEAVGPTGTEDRFWRDYLGTILSECGADAQALAPIGEEARRMHADEHLWSHVDPATPGALEELRRAGYRLGVVSNADGRVPDLLDRLGLGHHFEVVIDSGRVGVEKPDARIFEIALERMAVRPGASLYVGDLYAVDVVGARRAGIRPVLLDPWDAFGDRDVERVASVGHLPRFLSV